MVEDALPHMPVASAVFAKNERRHAMPYFCMCGVLCFPIQQTSVTATLSEM